MLHCWAKEPNKRPSFPELEARLQGLPTDPAAPERPGLQPLELFAVPPEGHVTPSDAHVTEVTLSNDVTKTENGDARKTGRYQKRGDTRL